MTQGAFIVGVWVVIYFIVGCCCYDAGTVTTQVSFWGGKDCGPQCSAGYTYAPNYACNDGRGDWNNGIGHFSDPIPPDQGYVMHKFNATMYINYCETTTVLILMGEALEAEYNVIQNSTTNCTCASCVVGYSFQSEVRPDGLVGYNYQSNNSIGFQLVPSSNLLCVSYIELMISYGPVSYSVTSLYPASGSGAGNTTVYVFGSKFYESSQLSCKFDTTRVPATWINTTVITCISPPSSENDFPYNVTVEVSEDGVAYTYNGVQFVYTPPPAGPPNHTIEWVWAAIGICVASVLFVAIAGYFYAQKHKRMAPSLIDENSRLINSDKFKQYGTVQPVDMSEIVIQQRIGRGSCAEVFMGTWRGTTVAIKKAKVFADDDEEFFMELSQEAAIMSELRHPNVLQFLGTASNPPELVIIMEFMARGSLYRIIHDKNIDLPWTRLKSMALDVARGMNYLHCSDPIIIHRDLKSHNLLVDEHFKVKVCDFGLSTMVKRHLDRFTAMTPVGTPCWTAPEVLRNELYTERADVFSFGVVLWELVTREDPYQGMPTFQIVIAVGQHKMRPLIPPNTPPALAQLMADCWNEDPNLRPPFSEIVSRLEKM